jgi:hypothetical protein
MKFFTIRNAFGLSLAVLLAACGVGNETGVPTQTAAMIQTNVGAQAAAPQAQVASAAMPAPDCAADGCKGLRIIDGNAEAYRYQAMQHAAAPQS